MPGCYMEIVSFYERKRVHYVHLYERTNHNTLYGFCTNCFLMKIKRQCPMLFKNCMSFQIEYQKRVTAVNDLWRVTGFYTQVDDKEIRTHEILRFSTTNEW